MIDDKNFADLFRQTPEMVCMLSGPDHRFEYVNEAHIRALGFDATGMVVREAQPESVEVHGILDEVYRSGKTADLREIAVTLTDRVRYFNLTYAARKDAGGNVDGIMVLGSEVTEQVQARHILENQQRWLQSVLNRLPFPTLFVDPATEQMTFQNEAAATLTDQNPEGLPITAVASGESLRDYPLELKRGDKAYAVEASSDLIPAELGQPATSLLVLKDVTAQKRIQKRLQNSEEQLTLALATSKVGFYDWNIAENVFVCSPQMRADWGLGEDRPMAIEDVLSRVHPDDLRRVQQQIQSSMVDRTPYEVEYRVVRPDGNTVWLDVRGKVHYSSEGRAVRFLGTSVDVSARVESQRTLRALADSMPQVVWAARPDGVFDYTNQRWTEYSGSSEPENWLEFVKPSERDEIVAKWGQSIATGALFETECHLLRKEDNAYRWHLVRANAAFDEGGRIVRWFGTATDIEDQKRAEDLVRFLAEASAILSGSLDYQATISQVANLAVPRVADWAAIDIVAPDGSIERLAVAHVDPAKVFLAHELWRRWPAKPDDLSGVAHVIRTGKSEVFREISDELLVASISDYELLETARALGLRSSMCVPLRFRDNIIGAISFISAESGRLFSERDLTIAEDLARRAAAAIDNARLYESEMTARKNADTANRMKDDFLATVSHELRTPLNAMLGWTRMMRSGTLSKDKHERALETIERNAVTQAQLIEDLLDVARIISGKLRLDVQSVEVVHMVEYALDALRLASDARGIQVMTSLDQHAGQLLGDPHRLGQVMWNLLSNAIKFTPKGGRINVVVERVNSSLRITVSDTGQGIAQDFLPYVFDRFKQEDGATTRNHGGLGLGLAISRHIVELHGGTIAVESKGVNCGSKFTVNLPMSPLRQEVRASSSRLSSTVGAAPFETRPELVDLKILVVDDEKDARDLVIAVLEQCGAVVRAAGSVEQALALVHAERPDILISDIGMPGEDGYSLIRRLRALPEPNANIPAAALTAFARAEDRRKALDAGFMMHVPKPVEPAELISVIANLTRFAPRAKADEGQ